MKVIVNGAGGAMGKVLCEMIEERDGFSLAARSSIEFETDESESVFGSISEFSGEADVIIDFSNHLATKELCEYAEKRKLPIIISTTGQTDEENALIRKLSETVPVFKSGNMSLGVALVAALSKTAAAFFPDADIEIVEKHHNRKLDVPSGTALMIADSIREARPEATYNIGRHENGKRTKSEIGIHSLRLGNEVGTHEVIIAAGSQTITIRHESENRALFADGALSAATFLIGKPAGLYDMNDIINNN